MTIYALQIWKSVKNKVLIGNSFVQNTSSSKTEKKGADHEENTFGPQQEEVFLRSRREI